MNKTPASMLVIEWQQFLRNGLQLKKPACSTKLASKLAFSKLSVTVGVFDGVHRGHQELISNVVSYNADYVPVIVTFRTINNEQLTMNKDRYDILSFQQRLALFEKLGIRIVVVIDFTDEFKQMSGIDFLQNLLNNGNVGYFAVGSGFKCGYQSDTDAEAVKKFFTSHGVAAEIVPHVMEGNLPISSSRIRKVIAEGNMELAQSMLGHEKPVTPLVSP